jgi:hypothetical protein
VSRLRLRDSRRRGGLGLEVLGLEEPSLGMLGHSSPVWIEGQARLWDLVDLVPFGRDPNGAASIVRINTSERGIIFERYCYKHTQG